MPHILLTRPNPLLARAAQAVIPDAEIHELNRTVPDVPDEQVWCFVDWLLDDMSGLEICRRLRAAPQTRTSHITMVLEGQDHVSRSRALAAGADDYIPGPLTAEALEERLRFYTGISLDAGAPLRSAFGLTLDPRSHQVRWHGQLIPLPQREFRLLEAFLARPDQLLSRDRIIALLDEDGDVADLRTVDVWVGRLRRTLEQHGVRNVLRTVRSMGYVLDTPMLRDGRA